MVAEALGLGRQTPVQRESRLDDPEEMLDHELGNIDRPLRPAEVLLLSDRDHVVANSHDRSGEPVEALVRVLRVRGDIDQHAPGLFGRGSDGSHEHFEGIQTAPDGVRLALHDLGDFVERAAGQDDFLASRRSLRRGPADLLEGPYEVPYLFFYGGEVRHVGEAQLPDARDARRDTIEGIDHGFHVLRRRFGKLANFVGHDGESATGVARVCGFDGGVHRQEIGLRRDASDRVRHFDDEAHIRLGGRDEPVELGLMALSFRRQVLERSYGDAAPRGDGGDAPHGGAHLFDGRTYLADGRA